MYEIILCHRPSHELRMQRFYVTFSDILHVTHLNFPFFYLWAFKINQRLIIVSPFETFILHIPQFKKKKSSEIFALFINTPY